MNTRYGRSDRIRTCGIDVPNVARYQLRHTPKCEKHSIFRSFSVSGQTCGQTVFIEDFPREDSAEKVSRLHIFASENRLFFNVYKDFEGFAVWRGALFCPRGRPRRCPAPKRRALPTAPHPDNGSDSHILVCFILRFTIISKHGEFVKIFRGFETPPSLIFLNFIYLNLYP